MNYFTVEELVAIYKAADLMVLADGKRMPEESVSVLEAMEKAGVQSAKKLNQIKQKALQMDEKECHGILAFFDFEQKKFVSSMLGAISSSDGDIADEELKLWRDLCEKCDLPYMNNRQAIDIFKSF